jgi:hypothetical protein
MNVGDVLNPEPQTGCPELHKRSRLNFHPYTIILTVYIYKLINKIERVFFSISTCPHRRHEVGVLIEDFVGE